MNRGIAAIACLFLPWVDVSAGVRSLSVPAETRKEMAKYSLTAYENDDSANPVKALLFVPKPVGTRALPMVVYIPGSGEVGEVERQFRQRAIFERVTSPEFQSRHPCFLLALTPPRDATTLLGGMPNRPTPVQKALRDFVSEICSARKRPRVDTERIYLTGFSYGGMGAYALGQHFPGEFAAVVPIAAPPPLPEYFVKEKPGNWWHFHNEGDYASHGVDTQQIEVFAKLVNDAGGDFRLGTYPASGHDSWTKAWREDEVWDWMFSKSLKGSSGRTLRAAAAKLPMSLASAVCSASVPGKDSGSGPERAVDGLDATWYESEKPFARSDWWQVDLGDPMRGKFVIVSGDRDGRKMLKDAYAECSTDGKRWTRVASFSASDGTCSFVTHGRIRYLRVKSSSSVPQPVCLRRLKVIRDGK